MSASLYGRFALIPALLLSWVVTSCGSVVKNPTSIQDLDLHRPSNAVYLIQAGDDLEIRFYHTPDLNVNLPVRPDGYISLPLAHEVLAAGKTVEELRSELSILFDAQLKQPEIAVIVRTFSTHRVHVGGKVVNPGVFPLSARLTVLEAVFQAGGYEPSARLSDVIVMRRSSDGHYIAVPVNLETFLDGSDFVQNIALEPQDVVYVPDSPVGDVNTFVDLYIRKNIPINFTVRPYP